MAINRIDFQGSIMRTGDYSQKQGEDAKIAQDQNVFHSELKKEVDERRTTVTQTKETDELQHEKHDAKEKGKNEYRGDGGRRRREAEASIDREEMEKLAKNVIDKNGRQVDLQISKGFDFKV